MRAARPDAAAAGAALAVSEFPGRAGTREAGGARAGPRHRRHLLRGRASGEAADRADPAQVLGGDARRHACRGMVPARGHPRASVTDELSRNAPLESVLELADNSVDGYEIAAAGLGMRGRRADRVLRRAARHQRARHGRAARGRAVRPAAAFLEAGCGGVLAPVWPADDEAMAGLMASFTAAWPPAPGRQGPRPARRGVPGDRQGHLRRRSCYWAPLQPIPMGGPVGAPPGMPPSREISHG